MRKIRIWRFIIMTIIFISLIFIVPWIRFDNKKVYFTSNDFSSIDLSILCLGILYLFLGFLANGIKNKIGKIIGIFNLIFAFLIIILLSYHTFMCSNFFNFKMIYFIPILSLLIIDMLLTIVNISIKLNVFQKEHDVESNSKVYQEEMDNNQKGNYFNSSSNDADDFIDLKNKINNMKGGLNKSYEEAIEEIEKTGALNGFDMRDLINNDIIDEENKIESIDIKSYKSKDSLNDNLNVLDPLSEISQNYEHIHSPSNKVNKNFKYFSRRNSDINKNN